LVTLQADLIVISWFISESTFFPCMLSLHSAFRFRLRLRGLSFRKLLSIMGRLSAATAFGTRSRKFRRPRIE